MKIFEQNFKRLEKILGPDWFKKEHRILKSGSFMDLHFEPIGENRFALAHNYIQNGDVVPDPDMEIRAFPELRMVEALTFQNSLYFTAVYPSPGMVNPRAKRELNQFLGQWLRNLIQQGFKDDRGEP